MASKKVLVEILVSEIDTENPFVDCTERELITISKGFPNQDNTNYLIGWLGKKISIVAEGIPELVVFVEK